MLDWFANLEFLPKLYWIIAVVGSLIFTIVVILSFAGGDADDFDLDAEIGFQFITFKNLVGFFTMFGWTGIACIDAGFPASLTIAISLVCGLVMMVIMASLFYFMSRLTDSGTLKMENALGAIGEVYLTIGADRSRIGKVTVKVQGSMRELDALTDSFTELKSGTIIKVVDVTSNGILIVDQTKKAIEAHKTPLLN
jgi:membrane protein implicated in regulation of membrane protease activity